MNPKRLFVGNLTYTVDEKQLWGLFSRYGEVVGIRILEGKGYGFVEMESYEEARAARNALNETEFMGRNLLIDDVRPPKSKQGTYKRPGGKFEGRAGVRPARPSGRKGPAQGDKPRSSRTPARSTPHRERDPEYKERTLKTVTRAPQKEKGPAEKKKSYGKPAPEEKTTEKKGKTRFWPGGKR